MAESSDLEQSADEQNHQPQPEPELTGAQRGGADNTSIQTLPSRKISDQAEPVDHSPTERPDNTVVTPEDADSSNGHAKHAASRFRITAVAAITSIRARWSRIFSPINTWIVQQWQRLSATRGFTACAAGWAFFKTRIWDKRMRFSFAFYTIVFIVVTAASVLGLQWSVYSEPTYAKGQVVDDQTKALNSVAGQLTSFVSQIWLHQSYQAWLNFIVLGVLYLTFILVINRFWVATALFGTLMTVFAIANKIKVELRNEPIIPADLQFVTGGNGGSIMSFTTKKDMVLINSAVTGVIWLIAVCVVLQFLDRRRGLIPYTWKRPEFVSVKNITAMVCRWVAAVLSMVLCVSFTWGLGTAGSWARNFTASLSDYPHLWKALEDAQINGPAINFLRLTHVKTMDKPTDYNKAKMLQLANTYANSATTINKQRTSNLTDNTVILILSESFSDPTRVPGVSFSEDPIPNIRAIKASTTSGLMLSPGYGGGTANIEYQALTGLNLANFNPSLTVPYQQLVPKQSWDPHVQSDLEPAVRFLQLSCIPCLFTNHVFQRRQLSQIRLLKILCC